MPRVRFQQPARGLFVWKGGAVELTAQEGLLLLLGAALAWTGGFLYGRSRKE